LTAARKSLFVVCGEPSGETYAVRAVRAFRERFPDVPVTGIGSSRLAAEGVSLLLDYQAISVVGLTEVVRHLPAIAVALRAAVKQATRSDTGAVLLVDFPEFNFRVGKRAHRAGIPVIYYIPPQVWAWRTGRARKLAQFTRGIVVPFPFEVSIFREAGANVRFAGHPLLDELAPWLHADPAPERFGIPEGKRVVGLLPGSRSGEISAHLPSMLEAAGILAAREPDLHFVLPLAAPSLRRRLDAGLTGNRLPLTIVERDRFLLYRGMAAALSASGTATLELALLGVPHVIVYRTSAATYRIGKRLARVSCIGLPNLVAGDRVVPELIQDDARPDAMARELGALLSDRGRRERIIRRLRSLQEMLAGPGPSDAVVEMLAREAGGAWE
jgi:lipid-A-disaccharide synthase